MQLTHNKIKYIVKTKLLTTASNYNTSIHVFEGKSLLCGTIIKETDNIKEHAIMLINHQNKSFKVFDSLLDSIDCNY